MSKFDKLYKYAEDFEKLAQAGPPTITESRAVEDKLKSTGLWRQNQPQLNQLLMKSLMATHDKMQLVPTDNFAARIAIGANNKFVYPVVYTGPKQDIEGNNLAIAGAKKANIFSNELSKNVGPAQQQAIRGMNGAGLNWNQWLQNLHLIFE